MKKSRVKIIFLQLFEMQRVPISLVLSIYIVCIVVRVAPWVLQESTPTIEIEENLFRKRPAQKQVTNFYILYVITVKMLLIYIPPYEKKSGFPYFVKNVTKPN